MGIRENQDKAMSVFGLSLSLAKANFKLRNEGSYLGIFWYILEPLIMFLILGSLQGVFNSGIESYLAYLLLGLIMFNFFSGFTMISINAIRNNSSFIKSIKVNYSSFVGASLLQAIFSHIFEVVILVMFFIYYQVPLSGLIYYPIILFFFIIFSLGVSLVLSTIGVYVNDLNNVWNVLTRILWFATPIFYTINESNPLYKLQLFNPIYYFISIARDLMIYNKVPDSFTLLCAMIFSVLSLLIGLIVFRKYQNKFAEVA